MQIYKGLPYFAESPYSDPKARSINSAKSMDLKFKLNPLKYSKSNSIFVKPVQKDDLDNKVKNSVIITRFTSQPKPFVSTQEMQRSLFKSSYEPFSARSEDLVTDPHPGGEQKPAQISVPKPSTDLPRHPRKPKTSHFCAASDEHYPQQPVNRCRRERQAQEDDERPDDDAPVDKIETEPPKILSPGSKRRRSNQLLEERNSSRRQ
jgi:hypothetical protein